MSTQQKYATIGRRTNAIESTADNQVKPTPTPDDWQVKLLQRLIDDDEARESLFDLLYLLWDFHDSVTGFEFLALIFENWVVSTHKDLNQHRYDLRNFINHWNFLNKLHDNFEFFDNNSKYRDSHESKKDE